MPKIKWTSLGWELAFVLWLVTILLDRHMDREPPMSSLALMLAAAIQTVRHDRKD